MLGYFSPLIFEFGILNCRLKKLLPIFHSRARPVMLRLVARTVGLTFKIRWVETSLPARGHDVAQVALVFVAHVFEQVAVDIQAKVFGDGPGACVGDGVFDGDVYEQMTEVGASEPLGDNEGFRVRVTVVVKPGLVVEAGGSDYQDVAFPLSG